MLDRDYCKAFRPKVFKMYVSLSQYQLADELSPGRFKGGARGLPVKILPPPLVAPNEVHDKA